MTGEYEELDVWFKRDPLWHAHRRGRWTHLFGIPAALACISSFGLIGKLTGYGGGLDVKRYLLTLEHAIEPSEPLLP